MHSRFFITFSPPRATLYLAGEFDITDRAELHRRIEDAIVLGCVRLEVDGAAVTFIDSAWLKELDTGKTRLAKLARSLVVRRASAVFERVANLSGYRGLLTESQTTDFSAPVTAPDGRTTFRRSRPLGGARPARRRLPSAPATGGFTPRQRRWTLSRWSPNSPPAPARRRPAPSWTGSRPRWPQQRQRPTPLEPSRTTGSQPCQAPGSPRTDQARSSPPPDYRQLRTTNGAGSRLLKTSPTAPEPADCRMSRRFRAGQSCGGAT